MARPKGESKLTRAQHYIAVEQNRKLMYISKVTGAGKSFHIREALDAFLKNHPKLAGYVSDEKVDKRQTTVQAAVAEKEKNSSDTSFFN